MIKLMTSRDSRTGREDANEEANKFIGVCNIDPDTKWSFNPGWSRVVTGGHGPEHFLLKVLPLKSGVRWEVVVIGDDWAEVVGWECENCMPGKLEIPYMREMFRGENLAERSKKGSAVEILCTVHIVTSTGRFYAKK